MVEYRDRNKYLPEYEKFLAKVPMNILICRAEKRHDFPSFAEIAKGSKWVRISKSPRGHFTAELRCKRKCGTTCWRYYNESGGIARSTKVSNMAYDYDTEKGYRLPKEASSGRGLTREMNNMARLELLTRLAEWITEE